MISIPRIMDFHAVLDQLLASPAALVATLAAAVLLAVLLLRPSGGKKKPAAAGGPGRRLPCLGQPAWLGARRGPHKLPNAR